MNDGTTLSRRVVDASPAFLVVASLVFADEPVFCPMYDCSTPSRPTVEVSPAFLALALVSTDMVVVCLMDDGSTIPWCALEVGPVRLWPSLSISLLAPDG